MTRIFLPRAAGLAAGLGLLAAACSEAPTIPQLPGAPDAAAVAAASQTFDVVTVNSRVSPNAQGAVVATLAQALERVRAGGEIRVLSGTHATDRVLINKPVTIAGNGLPTLDAGGADFNLAVDFATHGATAPGPVVIRGLRFVNGRTSNVQVANLYDTVLIENSEFHPDETGGQPPFEGRYYSNGVSVWGTGAGVTVRNSRFLEGAIGVIASAARVESSYFRGQSNASIHGGDVDAIGNVVDGCDHHAWCFFIGDFLNPIDPEIRDNRITTGRPVHNPIMVIGGGGSAVVMGNTIVGTDAAGQPLQPRTVAAHALPGSGLDLNDLGSLQVSGNTVKNLYRGIMIGDDVISASGRDNVIDNVVEGFMIFPGSSASIRFSDITNYDQPASVFVGNQFDITCNWWGSAFGPMNAADPRLYDPWATAPIAGTGATSCGG